MPKDGDFICNFHSGGTPHKTNINSQDLLICSEIKNFLIDNNIYLAGIDVVGGLLTEINITSPTCIQEINRANGTKLEKNVLDFIIHKVDKGWIMSSDRELVNKISKLSRLKIDESDIDIFVKNFKDILEYIDLLSSVDTNSEKTQDTIQKDYAVRDDTTIDKLSNDEVLLNAPNKEGKFFAVKKVIEGE